MGHALAQKDGLLKKELFECLACPSCAGQIVETKERVLVCPACLLGFRVYEGVPDLSLERAISLRKTALKENESRRAIFQIVVGLKHAPLELRPGHCVILGRFLLGDNQTDATIVARHRSTGEIDPHTLKLIEKYLTRGKDKDVLLRETLSSVPGLLGDFKRDADYLLDDSIISRRHALLYYDEKGLWVVDLVSKNGTYVNGKEIEHAKLRHNDILSLGGVSLRLAIL